MTNPITIRGTEWIRWKSVLSRFIRRQPPERSTPRFRPQQRWEGRTAIVCALAILCSVATRSDAQQGPVIWGVIKYDIRDFDRPFTAIAAGNNHTVAVKNDGTVAAWGSNRHRQCEVPAGLTGVIQVAAGEDHTLALRADGTVVAWGKHDGRQIRVPGGLAGVKAIAAGSTFSLALKENGTVVAWGDDGFGATTVPPGLTGVTAISAGQGHALALKNDGKVVAWGWDFNDQATVPGNLSGVIAASAGARHSLALKNDGTVVGWGSNYVGERSIPAGLNNVTAIAAGSGHSAALKNDGSLVVWGSGANTGGSNQDYYGVKKVPLGFTNITQIASGANHLVALNAEGVLENWGDNAWAQAARAAELRDVTAVAISTYATAALKSDGSVIAISDRIKVPTDLPVLTAISGSLLRHYFIGLKPDGKVVAWPVQSSEPATQIPTNLSGVTAIASGDANGVALRSNGRVFAWGWDGSNVNDVPSDLTGVAKISSGGGHVLALLEDGNVRTWGGYFGPAPVPSDLTGVVDIAAAGGTSFALQEDGRVVAWTSVFADDGLKYLTPPNDLHNVAKLAGGAASVLALKTNGTVVAWGARNWGYFDRTNVPDELTGVVDITAGSEHSVALVTLSTPPGLPKIIRQPVDVVARAGESTHFRVATNAPSRVNWRWESAPAGSNTFSPIPNSDSKTLHVKNVLPSDDGRKFRAVAMTTEGEVPSRAATLVVQDTTRRLDFDTPTSLGYAVKGDAFVDNDGGSLNPSSVAKITLDQLGGDGALVVDDFLDGREVRSLVASFRVGMGNDPTYGEPADGFSFVWGTGISRAATGVFGLEGAGDGLILTVHTYGASSATHSVGIALRWKGQLIAETPVDVRDLARFPEYIPVAVKVDADGTLDMTYGPHTVFDDIPLPDYTPVAGAGYAWGARTGVLNQNVWIDDIILDARTTGPVTPPAPPIAIEQNGNAITLTFTGTLQQSGDLLNWSDVPGAASPHTTPIPAGGSLYYKVK
jgi:alpha-tubulin suppressor-like RCC1 family protein